MSDFNQAKMNWNQASFELSQQGKAYVLITIVGVTGSTPRNSGTKMVVSDNDIFDTIGGGHLEHKAIKQAKVLLSANKDGQVLEHFQLGSQLGQCCGGNASVLFECFAANTINVVVFGAGHVGQALIPVLAGLPCHITWIDSREAQFLPQYTQYANVTTIVSEQPEEEVANLPKNALYVVMTHNHQMDFDISHEVLKRADFHYLGLIASDTKWKRFQQRYKHREVDQELVNKMHCPIGIPEVLGKRPMEVAVSIAGQIIVNYQNLLPSKVTQKADKGIAWQDIKQLLNDQPQLNAQVSKKQPQKIK